jgi:hypothetical protein
MECRVLRDDFPAVKIRIPDYMTVTVPIGAAVCFFRLREEEHRIEGVGRLRAGRWAQRRIRTRTSALSRPAGNVMRQSWRYW